ncbi:hypothetical protein [Castellaniella sp.]|uniref:hypothetical protein n=1 Tax=Castellaniella sp. TaxID=1955812 RepID=UPI002AFFFCBD|nr:hypothetical protein [Castellaniella sp.]
MSSHSMTIRIGASHWGAEMPDGTTFDFASMTSNQRREWYRAFGDAVWKMFGHNVGKHTARDSHKGGRA